MSKDPRIDAQIAAAPEWAAAVLTHLRDMIHHVAPDATEDIKWGRPFFLLDGKPFAMMAAFKAHCTFGFWRMGKPDKETEGGGQYGRITCLADLPDEASLIGAIEAAVSIARTVPPGKRNPPTPKPVPDEPQDLSEALAASPVARSGFDGLSASCRREYLEWVLEARRTETRTKRIAAVVAQAAEGKRLNWKYARG